MKTTLPTRLFISILLCAVTHMLYSQVPGIGPKALQDKIKNKTTVQDVMKEVEAFYQHPGKSHPNFPDTAKKNREEKEYENEYLHWKRWEYYAKIHAGPGGTFFSSQKKIWAAHEKVSSGQITTIPSSIASRTTPEWVFTGPFSSSYVTTPPSGLNGLGRCDRIAFHPTNPAIIFVGTPMGGLWKSTNYGGNWTCLTSFLPIAGVSGIVVDWSNPNTIYILTGNGDDQNVTSGIVGTYSSVGVFKTTDGGINWQQLPAPWPSNIGPAPYALKQSPRFPNKLLMATSYGLYYSANSGSSWSLKFTAFCTDVDYVPGTDTAYAAFSAVLPIVRSANGGNSFTNVSFGPAPNTPIPVPANRISLAVTNTNIAPNLELVYIFAGPVTGPGAFNGLYKTNAGGFISLARNTPNLFDLSNGGGGAYDQSRYDNCITVKPTNSNLFLTGGAKIFKSVNGGATIINSASYDENQAGFDLTKYVHGDIHDLAYNPLNNYLYTANDGGISYSTDDGFTWTDISTGLTTSMFYDIAGLESNQYAILCGLQDNGNKYRETATNDFMHIGAFDGYNNSISPSNPNKGYYSANQFLIKSDDLGVGGYAGIAPVTAANQWHWKMNTDLLDGEILFASTEGTDSVFTSLNGGTTWARKQPGGGQREIINCPSNANRLYMLGGISFPTWTLRRTDNQGVNWTANLLANPGIVNPNNNFALDVEVNPLNSLTVYICFGGFDSLNRIFTSSNAGLSWINITHNFPDLPVTSLAVDNNNHVYAATDYGVYVLLNGSSTWYFYANKLPRTTVNDLLINRTAGWLYAATYGRGIWRTELVTTPCSDDFYFVTGNVTGERFYEGGVIWSNAMLDTMQGTRVNFKVTDSIKLFPDFQASAGVKEFRAYTGPCGSGYPALRNVTDTTVIDLRKIALPANKEEGNYPYGTIRINGQNNTRQIVITAKKEGNYKLKLSNAGGKILKEISQLQGNKKTSYTVEFSSGQLSKGLYYVNLLFNDMLVMYQELVVD